MSAGLSVLSACGGGSNSTSSVDASGAGDGAHGDGQLGTDGSITVGDPALDGPQTVTTATATIPGTGAGRSLTSTVFTPSGAGPHALVVVSPGFQMDRAQYTSYANHLATWGFVVILTKYNDTGFSVDHTKTAQDVPAVITWALAQPNLAVDATKIGVAGHSLGGKISIYAATLDPRIKAVVAWDPVDSNSPSVAPEKMGTVAAAIAVIGETTDGAGGGMPCAPTADNFQTFYAASRSPALQVTVNGADHMDWVDDPTCFVCGFCTAGSAPDARARTASKRLDVAWFRRYLFADTAMDPWIDAPPELAGGDVAISRK